MTTENDAPEATNQPPELRRVYGLLVSEWVTYGMIVVVVAAVLYGFKVGAERDAQAERALATLDALATEAERVVAAGGALVCDDTLLDAEVLANDYLTLSIRPAPIDEDDESLGFGPALYVDVVEDEVSGDTWDTAGRLMALVREKAAEELEASEDAAAGDEEVEMAASGEDTDEDTAEDAEDDEPPSPLRKVRKPGALDDDEYLSYFVLASETALCSQDS